MSHGLVRYLYDSYSILVFCLILLPLEFKINFVQPVIAAISNQR